jgi:hypothetical protein
MAGRGGRRSGPPRLLSRGRRRGGAERQRQTDRRPVVVRSSASTSSGVVRTTLSRVSSGESLVASERAGAAAALTVAAWPGASEGAGSKAIVRTRQPEAHSAASAGAGGERKPGGEGKPTERRRVRGRRGRGGSGNWRRGNDHHRIGGRARLAHPLVDETGGACSVSARSPVRTGMVHPSASASQRQKTRSAEGNPAGNTRTVSDPDWEAGKTGAVWPLGLCDGYESSLERRRGGACVVDAPSFDRTHAGRYSSLFCASTNCRRRS